MCLTHARPWFTATHVVPLCYSTGRAAVELALGVRENTMNVRELRQSSPKTPVPPVLLGGSQGVPKARSVVN